MYLDSDNRPTAEFFPTKMQPALSAAVLPLCMRIPSKWGTFNNLGRLRPNLGDQLYIILYVPYGIADYP